MVRWYCGIHCGTPISTRGRTPLSCGAAGGGGSRIDCDGDRSGGGAQPVIGGDGGGDSPTVPDGPSCGANWGVGAHDLVPSAVITYSAAGGRHTGSRTVCRETAAVWVFQWCNGSLRSRTVSPNVATSPLRARESVGETRSWLHFILCLFLLVFGRSN